MLLNCIILKSRDTEAASSTSAVTNDRYVDYLVEKARDFHEDSINNHRFARVIHINPLRFEHVNLESIREAIGSFLLEPASDSNQVKFKCVIVTSRQTVECLEEALLGGEANVPLEDSPVVLSSTLEGNTTGKMIVYCVGDATLERFRKLADRLRRVNPGVETRLIVRTPDQLVVSNSSSQHEHKQNAQYLARLIEADYRALPLLERQQFTATYAFYPCSSIRKDELARHLTDVGIGFQEACVYRTTTDETSVLELEKQLTNMLTNDDDGLVCLVFFSPSSVDAAWSLPSLVARVYADRERIRFVSIGPSTTQRLKQQLALSGPSLDVYELSKPSPDALYSKLKEIV